MTNNNTLMIGFMPAIAGYVREVWLPLSAERQSENLAAALLCASKWRALLLQVAGMYVYVIDHFYKFILETYQETNQPPQKKINN
jgi:hypothetical protein